MYETVPAPRSTILDQPEGLLIRIPARRQWFMIGFLLLWLGGWLLGELAAIRSLMEPSEGPLDGFPIIWLCGWTFGGGFVILALVWMLAGEELVRLRGDALTIKRSLWGLGRLREYDITRVRNLRVAPLTRLPSQRYAMQTPWSGGTDGVIAFDYGATTIRFGVSLDEGEAQMLVERLRQRHPLGGAGG